MRDCIFDLYGTLVDIRTDETCSAVWEQMAVYYIRHGTPYAPEELRAAYQRLTAAAEREALVQCRDVPYIYPEIQIEFVFLRLFQEKGVHVDMPSAIRAAQAFRRYSTEYIRLYDGAENLLRALREAGRHVWLLSNAQSCFTMTELKKLNLLSLFDGICLSSDCGCKKPDRRFFEILLRKYSMDPTHAIMIGNDGVCDIQGAKAAGLSTLYVRSNLSPMEATPRADYVVETMDLATVKNILLPPT